MAAPYDAAPIPQGFRFVKTTHGMPPSINEYTIAASQTINPGDLVTLSSGKVAEFATGDLVFGVAAGYAKTDQSRFSTSLTSNTLDADNTVLVYDDLANTMFEAVAYDGGGNSEAIRGGTFKLVGGTDDATRKLSGDYIDSNTAVPQPSDEGVTTYKSCFRIFDRFIKQSTTGDWASYTPDWTANQVVVVGKIETVILQAADAGA